jgi:tetratricopeptide (TPR) repeat protein
VKSVLIFALSDASGAASGLDEAQKQYDRTEFEESLNVLKSIPQKDAAVYELMGQNYFMSGDYRKGTEALEKAVAADPNNSNYAMWLGRTYGRRAEMAGPLGAMGNASKARQYFEKAVAIDPANIDALNDLLDYQLEAPGFLGGGLDKARATLALISRASPAEGLWAESKLDEKRKQFSSAEEHLKQAVALAPQVGRLVALARFLARHGRYQESDQSFERAEQLAPDSPSLMYERAHVYIESHRNLDVAKDLLERYLRADITADDPPKADARKLLRKIEGS